MQNVLRLHEEILDVYHWLRPSKVETALRYSVFERVSLKTELPYFYCL